MVAPNLFCYGQEKSCEVEGATSSEVFDTNETACAGSEKVDKELQHPTIADPDSTGAGNLSSRVTAESHTLENVTANDLDVSEGGSKSVKVSEVVQDEKDEALDDKRATTQVDSCTTVNKLNDVYLNIRMPNGGNLQDKFSVTSTLRMVKEYVDEHGDSIIGSYDLAIPYPRKVFSDQGMYFIFKLIKEEKKEEIFCYINMINLILFMCNQLVHVTLHLIFLL